MLNKESINNQFILVFCVILITMVLVVNGCSDTEPETPLPDDGGTAFADVDFIGEQGLSVEEDGIKISIAPQSLSGNWTLSRSTMAESSYEDVDNVTVLTPIVRVQLTPGATGQVLSANKSVVLLTVTIPLMPGYTDQGDGTGVMSFIDEAGEHFISFADAVVDEVNHVVEISIVYSIQAAEWIDDRVQDGIDFYYVRFPLDCPVFGSPSLVATDDSPLEDKRPLIMVHGFSLSDLCEAEALTEHMVSLAGDVASSIAINDMFKVYYFRYPVNVNLNQTGQDFADAVNESFGTDTHIVIAAYSLGGLVARSAMETHGLTGRVDEFITIGTPHHGSIWAHSDDVLDELGIQIQTIPKHFDSALDLRPGSSFLEGLNAAQHYRGFYNCIAGLVTTDGCSLLPHGFHLICYLAVNSADGDMIVPLSSALLPGTQHDTFDGPLHNHFHLPDCEDVRARAIELLEFVPEPNSVLVPLAVGNWWEFELHDGGIQTLKIDDSSIVEYEGETHQVFHWRWYNESGPASDTFLAKNNEAGLYFLGYIDSGEYHFNPSLELRYPVSVGEQWYGSSGYLYTSMTIDELVTVPANIFSCNRYNYDFDSKTDEVPSPFGVLMPQPGVPGSGKGINSIAISPDIGIVKSESPLGTMYYELRDYNLVVK